MDQLLKKILYVEDEEDIRTITKIALEEISGYTLKICSNGKDTLKTLETFQPDLLILDVMMPGLDGPQTLALIRKNPQWQKIPAIFMTARAHDKEIEDYRKMGVMDVIVKPFDPVTLGQRIQTIWEKHDKSISD